MAGVVRGDAAANDYIPVPMGANLGLLLYKFAHEIKPRFASLIVDAATAQRSF